MNQFRMSLEYRARPKTKKAGAEAALEVPRGERPVTRTPESYGIGSPGSRGKFFCLAMSSFPWLLDGVCTWVVFVCLTWLQSGGDNGFTAAWNFSFAGCCLEWLNMYVYSSCDCVYTYFYIFTYMHICIHTYIHTYTRCSCCSGTSRFYLVPCSQTAFETKTREFEFQTDQNTEALSFVKGHFALSAQLRAEGVCQSEIPDWSVVFSKYFSTFQVFFGYINMFQKSRSIVINHFLNQKVTIFHLQNWCNTKIHHLKSVDLQKRSSPTWLWLFFLNIHILWKSKDLRMNFVVNFSGGSLETPWVSSSPSQEKFVVWQPFLQVALPLVAWKLGFFGPKKHWFSPQVVLSFVDFKILDHKNLHRFPLTWPVIFANRAKIIRTYHPIKAPKNDPPDL